MYRIILRNVFSNWAGFAVQMVITFLLTPYVLQSLGDVRYGVWILVTSLTGYYGFLSLGLQAGTTQQLTKNLAAEDFGRLNAIASTACAGLGGLAVLIGLAAGVVALLAPRVFTVSPAVVSEMQSCILVTGIAAALQFALFPFSAIFAAAQRYDLTNAIAIATRVSSAVLTVIVLQQGGGLVGLCVVIALTDAAGFLLRWWLAYWIVPHLVVSWHLVDRNSLVGILGCSLWNAVGSAAENLDRTAGLLIVGVFMTEAAVAPYALAANLELYCFRLLAAAAVVTYPAAARLHVQNDLVRLRQLYFTGARGMMLLAIAGSSLAAVWAKDFYRLWIGAKLDEWQDYPEVSVLFQILLVGLVVGSATLAGHQIVLGLHRIRLAATLLLMEGLLGVMLAGLLIRPYGLIGVALGTVLSRAVMRGLVGPIVVCRLIHIPLLKFIRDVCVRPAFLAVILLSLLPLIRRSLPEVSTWFSFFAALVVSTLPTLMATIMVGLSISEQRHFLWRPLGMVLGRFESERV